MSEPATPEGAVGSPTPSNAAGGTPGSSSAKVRASTGAPTLTARARRRREEAVRRLVADVQSRPDKKVEGGEGAVHPEAHEWMVASAVATALEKGLDRDLHADLVQETKDNASRISQICHDHSEVFLASVAKVAALGGPSADLANGLQEGQRELEDNTGKTVIRINHCRSNRCCIDTKLSSPQLDLCRMLPFCGKMPDKLTLVPKLCMSW